MAGHKLRPALAGRVRHSARLPEVTRAARLVESRRASIVRGPAPDLHIGPERRPSRGSWDGRLAVIGGAQLAAVNEKGPILQRRA